MQPLKKSTLFYYSLADMPVMMSIFPVIVFIPQYYSSQVGISVGLIGTILLVSRIFDVITDPLMGYISDHTRSRWGRRKPYIALSVPLMMISIYQLFLPPEDAGATHLLIWSTTLSLGTTLMIIPYYAWGSELTSDYNERSRVTGARAMSGVSGQLLAQLMPGIACFFFLVCGTASVLEIVCITMLIVMPICATATLAGTPNSKISVSSTVPVLTGLKLMAANKPFLQLVSAFTVGSIGLSITTPLYAFFIADVLKEMDKTVYMLTFFYLANLLSVPIWVKLGMRFGKHRAYMGAFVLIAFAHPFYMLLSEGDFWFMIPITIATGFAAGGFGAALPNSMKADVIDLDTLHSGENRAALFFSSWSFVQKLVASLGTALAMFGLAFFDFQSGGENGPDQIFGLRFLFSTFPSLFYLTAAALMWNYPITESRHAEIRAELDARAASTST